MLFLLGTGVVSQWRGLPPRMISLDINQNDQKIKKSSPIVEVCITFATGTNTLQTHQTYLLQEATRLSVYLESPAAEFELRVDDLHKLLEMRSFEDDMISILPKHLVDQRWCREDLQLVHLIVLLEVEKLLVQLTSRGMESRLDLMLVEQDAHIGIGRISLLLPPSQLFITHCFTIECARMTYGSVLRFACLDKERRCSVSTERLIQIKKRLS